MPGDDYEVDVDHLHTVIQCEVQMNAVLQIDALHPLLSIKLLDYETICALTECHCLVGGF